MVPEKYIGNPKYDKPLCNFHFWDTCATTYKHCLRYTNYVNHRKQLVKQSEMRLVICYWENAVNDVFTNFMIVSFGLYLSCDSKRWYIFVQNLSTIAYLSMLLMHQNWVKFSFQPVISNVISGLHCISNGIITSVIISFNWDWSTWMCGVVKICWLFWVKLP